MRAFEYFQFDPSSEKLEVTGEACCSIACSRPTMPHVVRTGR
jgi:hypothetical protein